MESSLEKEHTKDHEKCIELVKSLLDKNTSLEEIKASIDADCAVNDSLEEIIKDCLKNKMERKCCPEKIIDELKSKLGIGVMLVLGLAISLYSFQDTLQSL